MVLEESTHRAAESMAKLLDSLCKACIVSADQLKLGAKRVFDNMGDIVLGNYFKIQSRGLCEELSSSHSVSFACMTILLSKYNRVTKICLEQIITQDGDDDVGDDEDDDDEDGYYSISMRMLLDYIRSQL